MDGVGLCLQPLNNILCAKTNSDPPLRTAYLTMKGEAVQSEKVSLSHSQEELFSGDIPCLLGHAESFLSCKGKEIVQKLRGNIVLVCVDEVHVSLPSQWGHEAMRQDMYNAPSYLRAQVMSTTGAPMLAMSGTVKLKGEKKKDKSEIDEIKTMCSIQFSKTTVITFLPVLHNHLYVTIK